MVTSQRVGTSLLRGSYGTTPWFCLKSRPRQEPVALSELRNQGFSAFFPLRATGKSIEGLFPGYLFAQPMENGHWAPMRSTRGVSDVIMTAPSKPACVPEEAMNAVFAMVDAAGIMWPLPTLTVGQGTSFRVVDDGSPFAGFVAACSRTSRDRVFGLLEILGRKMEIGFARSQVEKVTA